MLNVLLNAEEQGQDDSDARPSPSELHRGPPWHRQEGVAVAGEAMTKVTVRVSRIHSAYIFLARSSPSWVFLARLQPLREQFQVQAR